LVGYLVVHASDCDSHLATLDELRRARWSARVGIGGVVVVGEPGDSIAVRAALRSYDIDADVITRGSPRFRALQQLARRRSFPPAPSLVLLDRHDDVVLARPSPTTMAALTALRHDVDSLLAHAP
jgi:hypothetical protein